VGDGTVIPGRDPFGAQASYRVLVRWARWKAWLNRYGDVLLAGVLGLAMLTEMLLWDRGDKTPAVVLVVLASTGLAVRRTQPIPAFIVCWLGLMGAVYFMPGFDNGSSVFVVIYFLSLFSLGAHTHGREVVASVLLVLIGVVVFVVGDSDGPVVLGDVVFATVFVGGPWATGLALRLRRDLAVANERLRVEQEERTRRAIAEERSTIARELHDVVAHAISVTVLQSRGARRLLGRDEEKVRKALDAIEHTNTQALGDMRRLLAILRDTEGEAGDDATTAPQPSLSRLDDLLDDVRGSGLPVEVTAAGDNLDVPPGVDLSAYRIIQEALTNVLKHAGPTTARVELTYGEEDLTLRVTDDGRAEPTSNGRRGHGLVGIRERVAVVGGEVEAGPRDGGGFEVRARLPYSVEA
jgi:signal transduction histidine kinase